MLFLITGVAGFIGSNLAEHIVRSGHSVVGLDNMGRKGSLENLKRVEALNGDLTFYRGDIRDENFLRETFAKHNSANAVFHLAGQVAVTTSIADPRDDFGSNALGTFNVLEAVRLNGMDPVLVYASTNKVYGKMDDIAVSETDSRYSYTDLPFGVSEDRPLDFHSPYGCSKGTGDQYVRDYARVFGLRTVCFRQSCIYGINQFGIEDQGWVAWFTIAALLRKRISVYGNGKQVRDVLFIDDLIAAYMGAVEHGVKTSGRVFNIGGGPANTLSIRELLVLLEKSIGMEIDVAWEDWRPGDQKVFIADVRKAEAGFGWRPNIPVAEGVAKLGAWACENVNLLRRLLT